MFEGQESVNILQLVPTSRKLSSTKFTFVMNCIFIYYKVKNIFYRSKNIYLIRQKHSPSISKLPSTHKHCVFHTLQHELVCKCPPRHQYLAYMISEITECLFEDFFRSEFATNRESNYASQVIFMCLRSSLFAVAVIAITTGTLANTAHNIY